LPKEVALTDAIAQWANLGGLVHALHTSDYQLISESLNDIIVEPHRSKLIPHFKAVKEAALAQGALGAGISGSGPSIFALSKTEQTALQVKEAINKVYASTGITYEIHVSKINKSGVKIMS